MGRKTGERAIDLPHPALSGADWADAWYTEPHRHFADARAVAEAVFDDMPAWVRLLMALRGAIVLPLGLKSGLSSKQMPVAGRIGLFPLISETRDQIVVGLNDRHLDFRCVADLTDDKGQQGVVVTTLIKRHNRFGRAYLAAILPFHRLILRSVMNQL